MRKRLHARMCSIAITTLLLDGLFAVSGNAQMTLAVQKYSGEAQQWATSMAITAPQDLTFRWTIDGPVPGGLHWEILKSFSPPTSVANEAWVRMHHVSPPPPGQFAVFKIGKEAVPLLPAGHGFWVRLVGTVLEKTRGAISEEKIIASPSVLITYAPSAAPTSFATNDPLWVKLTKILCEAETADGSPSDEVYAIVASVFINHDNVPSSPVFVTGTQLHDDMDAGEVRSMQIPVWGPPDGSPLLIDKPENAVVLVVMMENDGNETDNFTARSSVQDWMLKFLKSLPKSGTSDAKIVKGLEASMGYGVSVATGGITSLDADDQIGVLQQLSLTPDELVQAQEGQIVKKSLVFSSSGEAGRYRLRFQVGKKGLDTVAW